MVQEATQIEVQEKAMTTVGTMMVNVMEDDGKSTICHIETINFEGKTWLVPEWLDNKAEGWTTPKRIFRPLAKAAYQQRVADLSGDLSELLTSPIPISVLNGQIPPGRENEFVVVERPDVKIYGSQERH